ncbi:TPA: 50S ribosomal protein L7ae [Candidatus Bathyarchaeota archaeon]|nr:50S ribosomal protein L7ae [Candidatus Bathyarchaeota archaeon]HIJ07956.1 50S ribosomal protein L7ae [Candidatus Bathyarchaeota archaeon]
MSKPFYVKYEAPKEIVDAAYEALQIASKSGIVRKGTNEATKAVERAQAKLVVIAEDVDPPEVVAHLPLLCEERKIPYLFVPTKEKIGNALGIDVPCASACIIKEGDASGLIKEIITRLEQVKRGPQ